ncbi:CAP domain-containing protein [Pseudalkalibacillus salsuginis]|uniref:CAP domain-containing protein n=1 Tax=Pseudalkalibacillus salsuginis TaxID=2910972 RepID=UPI001F1C16DA|nr:CAP domain-containing protein [Pseudalkalibacillus salsuginis]MCF6411145.1 CAP domain-containing protein [Pseudalkalibacillus salsuginis]
MFKKILITSLLSASIFGVNAGIGHASTGQEQPHVQVYTQVAQVQVDQNQLQNYVQNCLKGKELDPAIKEKILEALKKAQNEQGEKKEAAPAEQPKAEQPAPEKEAAPAEQPAPEKEAAPAPEQKATPQEQPNTEQQKSEQPASEGEFQLTADEQKMVDLVNQERQKAGLAPLEVDPALTKMARAKSKDMIDNNYFSHNSPTYGSPFDMMKQFGITYNTAGENIAGNSSVEGAHTSLMNSDGHRKNILGSQYTKVGIGIVDGGQYGKMFSQEFTG